jgi:CRP/FNR family transcriptional regulator, cyclic AMP receptor protein
VVVFEKPGFDAAVFLANAGLGRRVIQFAPKEALFSQGDSADAFFIFRKAAQKSRLFPPVGRKLPSRWSPQATL